MLNWRQGIRFFQAKNLMLRSIFAGECLTGDEGPSPFKICQKKTIFPALNFQKEFSGCNTASPSPTGKA
jgi:hypothetical protein